jgi:hypothetical protein
VSFLNGEAVTAGPDVLSARPGDHVVLFYQDDDGLAGRVSEYLLEAIQQDGTVIVIATPDHRLLFERRLTRAGVDITAAQASGSYLALDASETMRRFIIADWADPASFWLAISPLIRQAAATGQPVRVYGEMVALLWDDGLVNTAIEVEAMWNEIGGQYSFSLLCAYPAQSVHGSRHHDALAEVCRAHAVAVDVPPEPGQAQRLGTTG